MSRGVEAEEWDWGGGGFDSGDVRKMRDPQASSLNWA